ncbi:lytic murein transglycosylase [Ahrensia marina]|uniref:Membrane protein n=1 Tax=Ahrensia marina TaxID=1514904 RepID=A0A0M9GLZ2_9HYPH|nr:lytic murein transglycosylase [Ahrensia marina]KPB00546.1 membrane protein [Ahrensia marina]
MLRLTTVLLTLLVPTFAFAQGGLDAQYRTFLETKMWPKAKAAGVSRTTFDNALAGKKLNQKIPGLVTPGTSGTPKKIRQAEFSQPSNYFNERNLGSIVATGRNLLKQNATVIKSIERKYGVPGRFLIAIWGRESGFGRVAIPHDAFEVLSTKAFMSTRPELFQGELIAGLQMVERGLASPSQMKSSWAGALGQPQFLPSSYLKYAVDMDGNGKPDIWNSTVDTLGSIGAYLNKFGWQEGRDWGFEVILPNNISCAQEGPDNRKTFAEWARLGVKRVNGKPFPKIEMNKLGSILMPAGRSGPAFIVTPNFYVFKEYNESDLYALFVGHAGDRIQYGGSPFKAGWRKTDSMLRSDIASMQRNLEKMGMDVGGADGLPGFKTRRSIGDWESAHQRQPTCFPSNELIRAIK